MKKKCIYGTSVKKFLVAVPASALMLGAAHAGTTVGLNFQSYYYDSGTTPQTVGYGSGYQTTGFPVTAKAFGVETTNWWNTDPLPSSSYSGDITFNTQSTFAGSLSASATFANTWQTGIGSLNAGWVPEAVAPGNDEVTWGIMDNTGWSMTLSNLSSIFPNGYVVEAIAAGKVTSTSRVYYTDAATFTNASSFTYYTVDTTVSGASLGGNPVVGTSISDVYSNDVLTVSAPDRDNTDPNIITNANVAVGGFVLTDRPVVTWMGYGPTNAAPFTTTILTGGGLTLNSSAFGIPPLSYQWLLNGTNIPGATSANYTNTSVSAATGGSYQIIVTNLYGSVTSDVATVTVLAPALMTWSGNVNSTWDIGSTANWTTNGMATPYLDGSLVLFDDTATTPNVNVDAPVAPYSITMTNNTKAYTIEGSPITGATSLFKSGTNGLILSGANTFTGPITVDAGTLTIADSGVLGGGSYGASITNNGAFVWASSANQTNNAGMTGSGSFAVNGAGVLTLNANAPVTGGVAVNSGILELNTSDFGGTFSPGVVINTNGTVRNIHTHALGGGTSLFINRGQWLLSYEDYKQNLAMVDGYIGTYPGGNGGQVRIGYAGGTGNWTWYVSNSIAGSVIDEPIGFLSANSTLTLNVQRGAAPVDLTINGTIDGSANAGNAFIFTGNGITELNGPAPGLASTTVNGGTVTVNNATSGGTTSVGPNGTLYAAPNVTFNGGASIGGLFAFKPADSIGTIYIGGNLGMTSSGITVMRIAKDGGSPVADNLYAGILSGGSVSYNGTLVVTNITGDSTALATGDTFTLFSGTSYSGGFTNYVLPALPVGLGWDTSQLLASGSIAVVAATPPPIISPAGGNYVGAQTVTISGVPGATIYYTTNGTTPTAASPSGISPVTVMVPDNTINFIISAYAYAAGYPADSTVVSATYNTVAVPTWLNVSGGSWQDTANWSNNIPANGIGIPANFSTLTLSANTTVTLDGSPTAGSLNFADAGNTYGWLISAGSVTGSELTLDNGTNIPVINVQNQSLTITNANLAGNGGLTKNGNGALVLGGNNITYTGPTVINGGSVSLLTGGPSSTLSSTNITINDGAALVSGATDSLGYSGSKWVRILNLNGSLFTNAVNGNQGWGLTITMKGGVIDGGASGGALVAGAGAVINTLATNIPSKLLGKVILREGNPGGVVPFNVEDGAASTDLLVSAIISQANGTWGIAKSGAGTMILTATNTYTGVTVVSNGTLVLTGVIAGKTNTVAGGTLTGSGQLNGATTVQSGASLQPGLGGGDTSALTISNTLTLGGNAVMTLNRASAPNASSVRGISTLIYGGTLTVVNAGDTLQQGDTFTLFSAANYTGSFSATNLPVLTSGLSWSWAPNSGTLSVVSGSAVNPNPTNIVVNVSGNALTLSWPTDHTGWYLQGSTNLVGANWITVPGSQTTNSITITIDPAKPTEFYRLMYNP